MPRHQIYANSNNPLNQVNRCFCFAFVSSSKTKDFLFSQNNLCLPVLKLSLFLDFQSYFKNWNFVCFYGDSHLWRSHFIPHRCVGVSDPGEEGVPL